MRELAAFLAECIATGALFYCVCALLVVPIAAWSLIRLVAPTIKRMDDDPAAQAWFAGSAALVPGVLLLTLAGFALVSGLHSDCLRTLAGWVLFALMAAGLVAATRRASHLFLRRSRDVRAFVRITRPAAGRLARIAKRAGVAVREYDDPAPTCMLAGIVRPTIVVIESLRAVHKHQECCRKIGLAASMGDHAGSTRLARILGEQRADTTIRLRRFLVAATLAAISLAGGRACGRCHSDPLRDAYFTVMVAFVAAFEIGLFGAE
jgi:hypothetical protein